MVELTPVRRDRAEALSCGLSVLAPYGNFTGDRAPARTGLRRVTRGLSVFRSSSEFSPRTAAPDAPAPCRAIPLSLQLDGSGLPRQRSLARPPGSKRRNALSTVEFRTHANDPNLDPSQANTEHPKRKQPRRSRAEATRIHAYTLEGSGGPLGIGPPCLADRNA